MKYKLLIAFTFVLFSTTTYAQPGVGKIVPKVMLGLKVGGSFNALSGKTWEESYTGGVVGGAFLGFHKKRFGVQGEALVRTAKFEFKGSSGKLTAKTVNLDVPVLVEVKIIPRLWLQVGPQFTAVVSQENNSGTKDILKTTDFSGVAGLQAILPLHFIAGARYIHGFADVNSNKMPTIGTIPPETWNNRSVQVFVGYRFL